MNSFDQLIRPSTTGFLVLTKSCDVFSLFDSKNTSPIRSFQQKGYPVDSVVVSPAHNCFLALPFRKSLLCFYSMNSPKPYLKSGTVEKLTSGFLAKGGDFAVFGSIHGNAFIFNCVSGVLLGSFRVSSKAVLFADSSTCGHFGLFACEDNRIYIYRIQSMISNLLSRKRLPLRKASLRKMVLDTLRRSAPHAKWKTDPEAGQQRPLSSGDFLHGRLDAPD